MINNTKLQLNTKQKDNNNLNETFMLPLRLDAPPCSADKCKSKRRFISFESKVTSLN